jgi:hypothetical protein
MQRPRLTTPEESAVDRLDSTLPSRRLDDWLLDGPARGQEIRWRRTECGLKQVGDQPPGGYPLCVDFIFEQSGVSVWGSIVAGTIAEGIQGSPRFMNARIQTAELSRVAEARSPLASLKFLN